jgi:hypothetical protein
MDPRIRSAQKCHGSLTLLPTYVLSVGGDAGLVAGPTLASRVAGHLPLRVTLALP